MDQNQKRIFTFLFGPAFLAIVVLLALDHYRQYAIVPVLLFWIVFFVWDSRYKKKKAKEDSKK